MKKSRVLIPLVMTAVLITGGARVFCSQGSSGIKVEVSPKHEIRYISGKTVYVESLRQGRWVDRYWSADGRVDPSKFWTGDNAFEIRVKNRPTPPTVPGTSLSMGWQWVSSSETPGSRPGTRDSVVELYSLIYPIDIKVHTLLDGTPVLTRWLEITNKSSGPLALTALSPWCGRLWAADAPITLGHSMRWDDQWAGWIGWTPLTEGSNAFDQDRGLAWDDPYFLLHNTSRGEYFFGQLAWPVNYHMKFYRGHDGVSFSIGPSSFNALRVIPPGKTITTPAVHLGPVKGDFDQTVQAMHQHIRRSVLPTRDLKRSYLIQYLFPEDQPLTVYHGDQYNMANVEKVMDVAAAAGAEVFILDGPTWCETYGDWLTPNLKAFPNGLGPLVEYAHKEGLLFGLYAETEGGRNGYCADGVCIKDWPQSEVYKEHPWWFVQPNSVLNLSIPAAGTYFRGILAQMADHYHLDLYRHDFNSPLRGRGSETKRDGFLESDYWRHYQAFYSAFQHLHKTHPDLILQQASAGGTRLDLDTVGTFSENYTTDRASFPDLFRTAAGVSVFLPPEILVSPNGMSRDLPDTITSLRGIYALGNTPMIFNGILPKSLENFKPALRQLYVRYAKLYKTFIRPLLPTCRVYHFAPINATSGFDADGWLAMEFTSPNGREGWATIVRLNKQKPNTYLFKAKGLNPAAKYQVTSDNTGKTTEMDGGRLMQEGVSVHTTADVASELLLFKTKVALHR